MEENQFTIYNKDVTIKLNEYEYPTKYTMWKKMNEIGEKSNLT